MNPEVVVVRVNRVQRRLVAAAVAAIALLGIVSADDGSDPSPAPGRHYDLDCLPFTSPTDVAGINRLITKYRSVPGFVGADVGADVLLHDGRRLWVFGDTLRQSDFPGQKFVRNSMLMFSPGCATVVMPSDRGAVVPDRADGVGYWPMDVGVVHHLGFDVVGISLQRVRTTGSGVFDFEVLGPAIATFVVPAGRPPQLTVVHDLGPDSDDPGRPMWGAAIETTAEDVYVYGTSRPDGVATFGLSLQVARAPIDAVADQTTWRYWDGSRWQRDPTHAAALIPAVGGVSQVLSVFERDGSWYAVSKRDDFLGKDLVIWEAPEPTGPFVASAPLAEIPSDSRGGLLRYMPLAHPDLLPSRDSVVVSYSRNVADLQRLLEHPGLYRPRFLEVPLP
jgi:hypothetical protein